MTWMLQAGRALAALILLQGCASAYAVDGPDGAEQDVALASAALEPVANRAGIAESAHTDGVIDRDGAFFQPIGTIPGRTCEHCHFAEAGWSLTPKLVKRLFDESDGLHPMFSAHDMGSRMDADVSTREAREKTFRTALERGLTRFTVCTGAGANPLCLPGGMPDDEFVLLDIDDPTGFSTTEVFSLFRHPTATANSAVAATVTSALLLPSAFLGPFSASAAGFHLFAPAPTPEQVGQLGGFQLGHFFAQRVDDRAGALDADGAGGGPDALLAQPFYLGINDLAGDPVSGAAFDPWVFDLFDAWSGVEGNKQQDRARRSIARGQDVFNFHEFDIAGVAGLNDALGVETLRGTCSSCHNAPNVGSHSLPRLMNIGTGDAARRWKELPLLTVQRVATGEVVSFADLGLAVSTGRWNDIGKFRVPPLRGLRARAPLFHDASATDVGAAVDYHAERFGIGLDSAQRRDLIAFLEAL